MISQDTISSILEEHLRETDLFLVSLKISVRNKIIVALDGDQGVPISACIKVSRLIESQLDREKEDFELEVTSVGIDTPLSMPRQYIKNTGREIVYTDSEGKKQKARIISADAQGVTLERELPKKKKKNKDEAPLDPVFTLAYDQLNDVKVQVSFKEPKPKQ